LASAVATLHAFGTADDGLTTAQQIAKMANSPLSVECGLSEAILVSLAQSACYQARETATQTIDPVNGYSDGHTHCEIKVGTKWTAFDASINYVMEDAAGNMLSVMDACEGVWAGTTQFSEIAPFQYDAQPTVSGGWNPVGLCLAEALYDPIQRSAAMPRLWRIPMIRDANGLYYFYTPPGAEAKQAYAVSAGYQLMTGPRFSRSNYP
jgi:hypothetical protein